MNLENIQPCFLPIDHTEFECEKEKVNEMQGQKGRERDGETWRDRERERESERKIKRASDKERTNSHQTLSLHPGLGVRPDSRSLVLLVLYLKSAPKVASIAKPDAVLNSHRPCILQ